MRAMEAPAVVPDSSCRCSAMSGEQGLRKSATPCGQDGRFFFGTVLVRLLILHVYWSVLSMFVMYFDLL